MLVKTVSQFKYLAKHRRNYWCNYFQTCPVACTAFLWRHIQLGACSVQEAVDQRCVFNRPDVTGAVLQTHFSLINSLTDRLMFSGNNFRTPPLPNRNSQGDEMLREGSHYPTYHVSHVMCHVSHATCPVSHVICPMHIFFFSFSFDKVVNLVAGGSVNTRATPSSFLKYLCQN